MKSIIRVLYIIYQICIAWPLAAIVTMLTGIFTSLFSRYIPIKGGDYYPGLFWSKFMCAIFLLPIKIVGRENLNPKQNYVFVANHQGTFDIFLLFGHINRNYKWIMKDSLRKAPFIGQACADSGHLFVNRRIPQKDLFANGVKILNSGIAMTIFAEGTRSATGKLGKFRKGAFIIADEAQTPVVPIAIDGSYKLFPKNAYFLHWTPITITFHKPIMPIGVGEENINHLLNTSRNEIAETLGEIK